ncbi:hypothetical protein BD769DRAFT_1387465 [Suillus cothurnatus]|nr:hypothetical protein BD769DRAFT_1387465 [Suillus cothurnatus]
MINQGVPLQKATKVVRDVPGMGKAPLEMERLKLLKFLPPDGEQALESGNDHLGNIDMLRPKQKKREENNTLHSFFEDTTNVWAASVPATGLSPLKRRKLRRQSEMFEEGSIAKVAQEIAVVREALGRIQKDLGQQSINLLAICEVIQIK